MNGTPSTWITSLPPWTALMENRLPLCCRNSESHSSHSMCEWTSIAVCTARGALLLRDLLVAHDLGPARDLGAEQVLRGFRRTRPGLGRLQAQALDDLRALERRV